MMCHKKGQLIKKVTEPFLYEWKFSIKGQLIKKFTETFLYKW